MWGYEALLQVFRKLSPEDKEAWLGPAPSEETMANIGFRDIQIVLESIVGKALPAGAAVYAVPPGKLEANALSESAAVFIKTGMTKVPLVSDFFEQWWDETLGERLAEAFREKYKELRNQQTPDFVFSELQRWISGDIKCSPDRQMAALAVLAYFFERCDIFEALRSKRT